MIRARASEVWQWVAMAFAVALVALAAVLVLSDHPAHAANVAVSGTITSDGVTPVAGAGVSLFAGTGRVWAAGVNTPANGTFSLSVPTGSYTLHIDAPPGSHYVGQWYNGGTGTTDAGAASSLNIAVDTALGSVTLVSGHIISGTITSTGTPVSGIQIHAYDSSSGVWAGGTSTDGGGNFAITVAPGQYRLEVHPTAPYLLQWYNGSPGGAPTSATATVLDLRTADTSGLVVAVSSGKVISGTVTGSGGVGLPNVWVGAYSGTSCCTWAGGTRTGPGGTFSLAVAAGSYRLQIWPDPSSGYLGEWYTSSTGGSRTFGGATVIDASSDVAGIAAPLSSGNLITGRVTNAGGTGVGQFSVGAFTNAACCSWVSGSGTDSGGNFSIVVPAGTYKLQLWPQPGTSYVGQWYNGVAGGTTSFALASIVDASAGAATPVAATVVTGNVISGQVTGTGGVGLAGVGIGLFDPGSCCTWRGGTGTDASGRFSVAVAAGSYKLNVWPGSAGGYLSTWYGGAGFSSATAVDASTASVSGLSIPLSHGNLISGHVANAGASGLAGVSVNAFGTACCSWGGGTQTDANGDYAFAVAPGSYKVDFYPAPATNYVRQWYNGAADMNSAAVVNASAGDVANVGAVLATGRIISGTVTASGGGAPVAGVNVNVWNSSGLSWVGGGATDSAGNFRLAVAPGVYKFDFSPPPGSLLVRQWYSNASTPSGAVPVDVRSGDALGINAALAAGHRISGTVRGSGGVGLANAGIAVDQYGTCCTWVTGTGTDSSGAYSVVVPSGIYKLQAVPPRGSAYVSTWLGGSADFAGATLVTLGSSDLTAQDITLTTGRVIPGFVRDGAGAGIPNVSVNSYSSPTQWGGGTVTDSSGAFTLALPPGQYKLQVFPSPLADFLGQWYNGSPGGSPDFAGATNFDLRSADAAAVTITLSPGLRVSGKITSDGSTGVASVGVWAYTGGAGAPASPPHYLTGTQTDNNGNFNLEVAAGTIRLQFGPPPISPYISGWYGGASNAADFQHASDVVVAAPVAGLAITLSTGTPVSGLVTSDGVTGVANVRVSARPMGGGRFGSGTTDSVGRFSFNLAPGDYQFQISPQAGTPYLGQYYNGAGGAPDPSTATTVTVASTPVSLSTVTLAPGLVVSGKVFAPDGVTGLPSVTVNANKAQTGCAQCYQGVASAGTDSSGNYALTVPAGTFRFSARQSGTTTYPPTWSAGAPTFSTATPVAVSAAQTLNITMLQGFAVSGQVTAGGVGAASVSVAAFLATGNGEYYNSAGTDSSGNYSILLPNGSFRLQATPAAGAAFLPTYYASTGTIGVRDFSAASNVVVSSGALPGIGIGLRPGYYLSGTVTGPTGPMAGAFMLLYQGGATPLGAPLSPSVFTNPSGGFRILTEAGDFKLRVAAGFSSGSPVAGGFYGSAGTALNFDLATTITVGTADVPNLNVALAAGVTISGTATAGGVPAPYVPVQAFLGGSTPSCCSPVGGASTDSLGHYTLVVPAGNYRVGFQSYDYGFQWWNGATSFTTATDVVATTNQSGIDAALSPGHKITGRVTRPDGTPMSGVSVEAYSSSSPSPLGLSGRAFTDSSGNYTLHVRDGSYLIRFDANATGTWLPGWYSDRALYGVPLSSPGTATPVIVAGADDPVQRNLLVMP